MFSTSGEGVAVVPHAIVVENDPLRGTF